MNKMLYSFTLSWTLSIFAFALTQNFKENENYVQFEKLKDMPNLSSLHICFQISF